jgi:hypothetical protein
MSTPAQRTTTSNSAAVAVYACSVTATDGYTHQVTDSEWIAVTIAGRVELSTLCRETVTKAPLTQPGVPCRWCGAVADHLELADPMQLDSGRVERFARSLKLAGVPR